MISVNDTVSPKTGGEYVYRVMKEELLRQGRTVYEISVPLLLRKLEPERGRVKIEETYRLLLHARCVLESFWKRLQNRFLVITSSSPVFPVFGHLVYHQPKTSTCTEKGKEYLSIHQKIGMILHENEKLSPTWLVAKRSHVLHLSNSLFTKRLIKGLYGLDSLVLYPPVDISSLLKTDLLAKREPAVLVTKPRAISGISILPEIVMKLPKTHFVVIGEADSVGSRIINCLKKRGANIHYMGYVDTITKQRLFSKCTHYLQLGLNESFGITVIEAMAAGCVPVAPESGAIPEYLHENLFYKDTDDAVGKIEAKVGADDVDLRSRLRQASLKFEEKNFRAGFMTHVSWIEQTKTN
jgi:glycosyltransferase involved in cell wall biosynthesis